MTQCYLAHAMQLSLTACSSIPTWGKRIVSTPESCRQLTSFLWRAMKNADPGVPPGFLLLLPPSALSPSMVQSPNQVGRFRGGVPNSQRSQVSTWLLCLLRGSLQRLSEKRLLTRRTASLGRQRASLQCPSTWPSTHRTVRLVGAAGSCLTARPL